MSEEVWEEIPILDEYDAEHSEPELAKKPEQEPESPQPAKPKRPLDRGNKFDQLMFGKSAFKQPEPEETPEQEVNYFQIMGQLDDIMASLKELKPIMKEFSPIVEMIKNKLT
ncbi:hypothetical protein LRR81_11945 [Metabacillus sp. GX 13764]|uniref:hypothetical protein n=1 Tax=Metabacillus kandeliae TaxID=2900151 RepID=UPI001E3E27E8|nr:hypothetical protein [Metabacillus kandeliae]MCD7034960.1 hypothetical protein [Metabacillus kandeliae]